MAGRFEAEFKWAKAHADTLLGKQLLSLASMYQAHADLPTYALIEAVVEDIRTVMRAEPKESSSNESNHLWRS